jgi:hypothetical protein
VQQLKAGEQRDKIKINPPLKVHASQKGNDTLLYNAIDLAVRLWLMVHIGNMRQGVTGQTPISRHEGSMKDAVGNHFKHQRILTNSVKFEKVFNARNIARIADVNIQWTPNLVDHLRFNEDSKKPVLNIFHHASFLEYHRDRYAGTSCFIISQDADSTIAISFPLVSSTRHAEPCSTPARAQPGDEEVVSKTP